MSNITLPSLTEKQKKEVEQFTNTSKLFLEETLKARKLYDEFKAKYIAVVEEYQLLVTNTITEHLGVLIEEDLDLSKYEEILKPTTENNKKLISYTSNLPKETLEKFKFGSNSLTDILKYFDDPKAYSIVSIINEMRIKARIPTFSKNHLTKLSETLTNNLNEIIISYRDLLLRLAIYTKEIKSSDVVNSETFIQIVNIATKIHIDTKNSKYTADKVQELRALIKISNLKQAKGDGGTADAEEYPIKIENLTKESNSFEEDFNNLKKYISSILVVQPPEEEGGKPTGGPEESWNKLLIVSSTEKETVRQEATALGKNVLQYIFYADPRLIEIYNNPINLKSLEEESYPNFNFHSDTYYSNWETPFSKLVKTSNNYIGLEAKLEDIKTLTTTENLLKNDPTEVITKINDLLTILQVDVRPNIASFNKSITFFTQDLGANFNLFIEGLKVELEGDIILPFNLVGTKEKPSFLQDIQSKVLEYGLTRLDNLILELQTLKKNIELDTVEDVTRIFESTHKKEFSKNNGSLIEIAYDYKSKTNDFCQNIIKSKGIKTSDFVNKDNLTVAQLTKNIYYYMFDLEEFAPTYNKFRKAEITTYKPLADKLGELSQPDFFSSSKDPIIAKRNQYYDRWCRFSLRANRSDDINRFNPLLDLLEKLDLAIENNNSDNFNKAKKDALELIEYDMYPDISMYFIATEIFDVNNFNNRIKQDQTLYMPNIEGVNFNKIALLKFDSYEIVKALEELHKGISKLTFNAEKYEIPEIKSNLPERIKSANEQKEKSKPDKKIELPKENWGIRISPAGAFRKVKVQSTITEDEEGNTITPEANVYRNEVTSFGKSWYMMLLPTMSSNLPVTGGSQAPGAQPGLNFKIVNSLVKHKVPGFAPIYQPMGIDTINCTIVGCFTGADGSNKYQIGNVDQFSKGGHNYSADLYGLQGQVGGGAETLSNVVNRFDSFENFQGFYNEIIRTNKEIEVEINLKKNTNVLSGGSEGIFRDGTTGNPKFQGYIKRFDSYYVREDRTWYIMDIQLTTNELIGKKCLNLTNIITQAVPENSIEDLQKDYSFENLRKCLFGLNTESHKGGELMSNKLPRIFWFGAQELLRKVLGGTAGLLIATFNGLIVDTFENIKGLFSSDTPDEIAPRNVITSTADRAAFNWQGCTLIDKTSNNRAEMFSISKAGYGMRYTVFDRKGVLDYELIGNNPLTPQQVFREVDSDKYSIDAELRFVIKYHCVDQYLNRPNPNKQRQALEGHVVKYPRYKLNNVPQVGIEDDATGITKDGGSIDLFYNLSKGTMAEKYRSLAEYDPKDLFDPKRLTVGFTGIIQRYKKYIAFYNTLNSENLLKFNELESVDECLKGDTKTVPEVVDATSDSEPEAVEENQPKVTQKNKYSKDKILIYTKSGMRNSYLQHIKTGIVGPGAPYYNNKNAETYKGRLEAEKKLQLLEYEIWEDTDTETIIKVKLSAEFTDQLHKSEEFKHRLFYSKDGSKSVYLDEDYFILTIRKGIKGTPISFNLIAYNVYQNSKTVSKRDVTTVPKQR